MNLYPYQYQVLRYIHDRNTGEFINLGVVLRFPDSSGNPLQSRFTSKFKRLSQFFKTEPATLKSLKSVLTHTQQKLQQMQAGKLDVTSNLDLQEITRYLLPPDDSSLIFTPPQEALAPAPEQALNHLFFSLVERYEPNAPTHSPDDKDVWKKVYQKLFTEQRVMNYLKPHEVKTEHDAIPFDYAWKNGSWHCLKPITFDLKEESAIKDKVRKHAAQIYELQTSSEQLQIYFLAEMPKLHPELREWVQNYLTDPRLSQQNIAVELIPEEQAPDFSHTFSNKILAEQGLF